MNIFPLRRRDALAELRLPDDVFEHFPQDPPVPVDEPQEAPAVSPANELATAIVERDIAEAVSADHPPPPPVEPVEMPAPLSQRHLETIDRMVAHLKGDEKRLEKQIIEAKRQLADTQLARHGYERNSAELRRGIAALIRLANVRPPIPRQPKPARAAASSDGLRGSGNGSDGRKAAAPVAMLRPQRRRKLH